MLFDRFFRKRNGRTESNREVFDANEKMRRELWDRVQTLETRVIKLEEELLKAREVLIKYESELLGIKALILSCPNIANCPVRREMDASKVLPVVCKQ